MTDALMTKTRTMGHESYGILVEPATLRLERLLPGPIERIWRYLTESDLRRQWLAAGDMDLVANAPFELVWRNDELSAETKGRPEGFPEEDRMESRIIEIDPPRKLVFAWRKGGEVCWELTPQGRDVLFTITHHRISDRANMVKVGAGWHMHLDTLVARANGSVPSPFWDGWLRLREEYEARLPG